MAVLGLPEGDLAAVRSGDDAAPALRALARAEQHLAAQALGPIGGGADIGDLHVGQPERLVGERYEPSPAWMRSGRQPKSLA